MDVRSLSESVDAVKLGAHKRSDDSAYTGAEHGSAGAPEPRSHEGGFWGASAPRKTSSIGMAPMTTSSSLTSQGVAPAAAGRQGDALQGMLTDRLSFQAEDETSDHELGGGFGVREPVRRSDESGRSSVDAARSRRTSTTQSRRSSFALERASFEANRSSLEAFGAQAAARHAPPLQPDIAELGEAVDPGVLCEQLRIPDALRARFLALAVVPLDTPLPMAMLAALWRLSSLADAEATANLLEGQGVMRVAWLQDGSAWALVQAPVLCALAAAQLPDLPKRHASLLDAYTAGRASLAGVPDDGYIMQNAGHHLVGAGRLGELKALLASPGWLERKLHSYGTASVVADFRRHLMVEVDAEVKLLLEAFQMSVSSCLAHPAVPLLRAQMLGRLMAATSAASLQARLATEEGAAEEAGRHAAAPPCLFSRAPSLEQAGGLRRLTLRGHAAGIVKVLLTPGGVDIITVSTDGTARVWDMEIGDCVLLLAGHGGPLTDVAASADGALLLTGAADGTARLWELEKGECIGVLSGHSAGVNSVAIDVAGRVAATCSADGTGRLWDLATCQCTHVLAGHGGSGLGVVWAIALTPDGRHAVTASEDFTARVWSVATGACEVVLLGHSGWVVDVAITADGAHALTASHDATARVWDLQTGQCVHVLIGHNGRLNRVRVAPSAPIAVTVSDDFTARVWDWPAGRCLHVLAGHGGWVADAALAPCGAAGVTASGDELAVVWNLAAGTPMTVLAGHAGEVRSVVLTRRGRFVVSGSEDATARVWDLKAGALRQQRAHAGRAHGIVVSADGATAASFGDDGALVWDAANATCLGALEGHAAGVRWAAAVAGRRLVTASADRTVMTWALPSGVCEATLPGQQGVRVKSFAVAADGRTAVVVLFDSSVAIWDLAAGQQRAVLQRRGERDAAAGHTGGVNAALLTADGARVLTLSKDCTARVWDAATGACLHVLIGHSDGVVAAALSADGRSALTIAYDRSARVWDMASGRCRAVMVPPGGEQAARGALSADGTLAAVATESGTVQLWDVAAGQPLQVLLGHSTEVTELAFSPDAALLASCSADCSLRIWDARTGAAEGFFMADAGLTGCAFTGGAAPDGIATVSENGAVHFLQLAV
ncbi:hypothetical protein WJX81_003475 [Elliptochloris bilobata]|uniref:APAF-1 helical domain-containing protein n=1 Tax=Elliptochloris bilobata TaxID=381761 RepID=A0AAW1S3R2_9CHLO